MVHILLKHPLNKVLLFKSFINQLISAFFFCIFPVDSTNGSSEFESGDLVSTVTRVMVSQNRLYSDSEEVVALQVFSEVIEMEGKKVNVTKHVRYPQLLWNRNIQI